MKKSDPNCYIVPLHEAEADDKRKLLAAANSKKTKKSKTSGKSNKPSKSTGKSEEPVKSEEAPQPEAASEDDVKAVEAKKSEEHEPVTEEVIVATKIEKKTPAAPSSEPAEPEELPILEPVGEEEVEAGDTAVTEEGEPVVEEVIVITKAKKKAESASPAVAEKGAAKMSFLHGILYVTINEAKDLPDCDRAFFNIGKDYSDPYVTMDLGQARPIKTSIIEDNLNPKWFQKFRREVCHTADELVFKVKDKDCVGVGHLGEVKISIEEVLSGEPIDNWYNLQNSDGEDIDATLHLQIEFVSAESLEKTTEVQDSYFPMHEGCRLALYQDAHTPPSPLHDEIVLANGNTYSPACAWRQIYDAIAGAEHFIYLTGWSVYAATTLLREDDDEKVSLGELISQKASNGVRVLALVWNEKFSTDVTPGLMGTHDEETADFFSGTDVEVILVPRAKDKGSMAESMFVSTCYSHHQKTVIVDTEDPDGDGRRRITAFVGGLDLTDGRWDTPEHHLFGTLTNQHHGDFYNKVATVGSKVGPRQPWHDIHSKIEGPAARDVYQNFVERWRKQAAEQESRLIDLDEETFILDDPVTGDESELWSAQLFRSINRDSAVFDPDRSSTLTMKKGRAVDDSIHRAYVHHIRRADNFIFIENQYFLGSTHAWDQQEAKAVHLIPLEIAVRICQKIAEGQRFAAYIIIPMYPEGDPGSMAVQEILHWQTKTIQMMYKRIADAIAEHGAEGHPTDYLNFYCLGKREMEVPDDLHDPEPETQEETLRKKLRLMIYVHSKMMITDDEYIIVGSANINQRSMGGIRDTEIAVGALQTEYSMEKCGGLPKGQVHGFRMALWGEHMGQIDETFQDPGSLECVQRVNEIASSNWDLFLSEDLCPMDGYLLKYPIQVEQDGAIGALPECEEFPDFSASVLGSSSGILPNKLTT